MLLPAPMRKRLRELHMVRPITVEDCLFAFWGARDRVGRKRLGKVRAPRIVFRRIKAKKYSRYLSLFDD